MVTLQPTMATDTTQEFHCLADKWTMWAHLPHDIDWSISSYKKIYTIDSVEGAIAITETMPEVLVKNCMLFLMREGIKPIWEDPKNRQGGCFSYKISNKNDIAHYDFGFVKPLDENLLHEIFLKYKFIITIEDGIIKGGFGSAIIEFASENKHTIPIKTLGFPDIFIEHGTLEELQKICEIDVESIAKLLINIS